MSHITQIRYNKETMEPIIEDASKKTEESMPEVKIDTEKDSKRSEINIDDEINDTSIIILCWNNLKYTKMCIDSIRKYTKEPYQIIAVNQGSSDGTLQYLEKALTGNRDIIISNKANIGFSSGNNQALKLAVCKHVLFLNNDCEMRKDNWLSQLIEANKTAGLVGALCAKATPNYNRKTFVFIGAGKEDEEWSYIEGWCLFGKRDMLLSFNGFDERFNPIYSEDADLSFRIKKRGMKIKAIPKVIFHYGSRSETLIMEHFGKQGERSNQLLYNKWIGNKKAPSGAIAKTITIEKTEKKKPFTILIRRKGAMGDVLMVTPIVRELKKQHPKSLLVFETDCSDVLRNNPYIDHTEKYILNTSEYDIVLTPRYEIAPGENAIDSMANQCNVKLSNRKMDMFLTPSQTNWAKSKIDMNKPCIAFHTGRTWQSREWPIERFRKVAQYFLENGYNIIELGDRQTQLMEVGYDCRKCSINQTAALIKECKIFVGIDSACANIAKAVGTPACVIYGCASPSTRVADAVEYPIWIDDLECKGCRDRTSAEFVECKQLEIYCLTRTTSEMVIDTIKECIKKELVE